MILHRRGTQRDVRSDGRVAGVHPVCWHIQTYEFQHMSYQSFKKEKGEKKNPVMPLVALPQLPRDILCHFQTCIWIFSLSYTLTLSETDRSLMLIVLLCSL
jgi:hypothetical protein